MGGVLDRSSFASSSVAGAEIVIGLVAPVGTDAEFVQRTLRERLDHFGYSLECVRVSELIKEFHGLQTKLVEKPFYDRVVSYMDAGNQLRRNHQRGDVLALAAIGEVQRRRSKRTTDTGGPSAKTAYLVRSFKHPDEVHTFREVYGRGFFLIGVSSSKQARTEAMIQHHGIDSEQAEALLRRDENEPDGQGQQTRDAFHLADAFCALGEHEEGNTAQLWRLLDLLFGQPFITPTRDEYSMFLAYAASVRSADLSRQVGAVVVSHEGEILATGANDVPAPQGGTYWSEGYVDWPRVVPEGDHRDWVRGYDSNRKRRDEIAEEVATKLRSSERARIAKAVSSLVDARPDMEQALREAVQALAEAPSQETKALEELADTKLMDLTEFGRAVHAEMDALMACTRVGATARGGRLFCTTFPCHNCTKHIVAAGIREVVYIEPYPKSLAEELYPDAVKSEGASIMPPQSPRAITPTVDDGRVTFRPFAGVGPRKYLELFSLTLSTGRAVDRKAAASKSWSRSTTTLRLSMVPTSYLDREEAAFKILRDSTRGERT